MSAGLSNNTRHGYSWGKIYLASIITGSVLCSGLSLLKPQPTTGSQTQLAAFATIPGAGIGGLLCAIISTACISRKR